MGLFNLTGQFGGWLNNLQMDRYNQQMRDWERQQQQYQQDMDYWEQLGGYDQQRQSYDMWSSGANRGAPIMPRQMPNVIGPAPTKPTKMNFGGGFGGMGGGMPWQATPFSGGGGGFNYGAFDGQGYQAPGAWNNPGIDTAQMVDPSAVIASAQPGIMENMNKAFADAGNRFGSSGMVGTPYAGALGEAARGAANDIANITNQYQFAAAQQAAELEQARQMAEYAADYNAWAQQGDWAHQGQLADMNQAYNAWAQMGDWQYGANQGAQDRALQQWMAQNDWRFQDYTNQQGMEYNMLQNMLPMLFGAMGGW